MNVAQDDVEEHGNGDPQKGHFKIHEKCKVIDFVAEKERPEAEVKPEYPIA